MAACCCCARNAGMGGVEREDCRTWEEELYWNHIRPLYFIQILSSVGEFHRQLEIPKKFADNARPLLPPKVTLRGPSRASWCAVMTKREDDLFLTDGWEEFARAYSLQPTNFLIFKFDGISAFDVLIFDGENLCEKESAYFVKKCEHVNAENPRKRLSSEAGIEECDDDDDGLSHRATKQAREEAVVNDTQNRSKYSRFFYSRCRKKKLLRKAVSSKASPRKRIPLTSSENTTNPSAENGPSNVQNEPSNNEPQNTETNGSSATEAPNQNSPSQTNGSFSAEDPRRDTPHINGSILKEAAPQSEHETNEAIPQRVASARGRPTKGSVSPRKHNASAPIRRIQTKASSSKLASSVGRPRKQLGANKAGKDIALGRLGSSSPRYVPEEGKLALEMARKKMTGNSFIVVMRPTTVCRRFIVTFPPAWCRKHLSPKSQDVFFRFGDKTFLNRLSYSPRKTAGQICGGWKQVVLENRLKLYDVCLFNVAGQKDDALMLDVTVFRAGLQQAPVHDDPSQIITIM